jgi:flagellar M-ring protein FliF
MAPEHWWEHDLMQQWWNRLSESVGGGARAGFIAAIFFFALLMGGGAYWLLRPTPQVLFGDLSPQDTAAMTAELDKMKVPYTLAESDGDGGTKILVDGTDVYKTRIKLMGKDIPLHGAVGFELFNGSDFGMTEFAQKINYQRALQGELTRTILSLAEVRDARVLLAFPEQSMFRQSTGSAKASVTLTLKPGRELSAEQVAGIQRLVAASVPGVVSQNVTIVDQSGVALTKPPLDADGGSSGSAVLELKKDADRYFSRKVNDVLNQALGAGHALASVDVALDMERTQSNLDEPVSAVGRSGVSTGVVVREHETNRGVPLPDSTRAGGDGTDAGGSDQRDVEYAIGHRVEQVVSQPGAIRRIQVAVVVNAPLAADQLDHLQKVIAASVGASAERGDAVVIQTLNAALPGASSPSVASATGADASPAADRHAAETVRTPRGTAGMSLTAAMAGGVAIIVVGTLLLFWMPRRAGRRDGAKRHSTPLTDEQRAAALAQLRDWMRGGAPDLQSAGALAVQGYTAGGAQSTRGNPGGAGARHG